MLLNVKFVEKLDYIDKTMEIIDKEQKALKYALIHEKFKGNTGIHYENCIKDYLAGFNEAETIYLKQLSEAKELLKEASERSKGKDNYLFSDKIEAFLNKQD